MRRACSLLPSAVIGGVSAHRVFSTEVRTGEEKGFAHKMRDISILTGAPSPTAAEGRWKCNYGLADRMEKVVPDVLRKAGWAEPEIKRELQQIFAVRAGGRVGSATNVWTTIEEFQRTPWYRRYRPADTATTHYVSHECIKCLEEALIPPSQRKDPYAHLRKRHYEDAWFNERFSEDANRHIKREDLAKHTKGMDGYGSVNRKSFMAFEAEYKKHNPGFKGPHEVYHAWRTAMGGVNE